MLGVLAAACQTAAEPFEVPDGGFACNDLPPLPQNAAIELTRVFGDAMRGDRAKELVQVEVSPEDPDRF